jgi:hypothetical protein
MSKFLLDELNDIPNLDSSMRDPTHDPASCNADFKLRITPTISNASAHGNA